MNLMQSISILPIRKPACSQLENFPSWAHAHSRAVNQSEGIRHSIAHPDGVDRSFVPCFPLNSSVNATRAYMQVLRHSQPCVHVVIMGGSFQIYCWNTFAFHAKMNTTSLTIMLCRFSRAPVKMNYRCTLFRCAQLKSWMWVGAGAVPTIRSGGIAEGRRLHGTLWQKVFFYSWRFHQGKLL